MDEIGDAIPTKDRAKASAWVRRRYVIALSVIGILAITAYGVFEIVLTRHQDVLTIVNISGRQRMLSQQTALFAQKVAEARTFEDHIHWQARLKNAADRFEQAHVGLTTGDASLGLPGGMSPRVRSMYYEGPNPLDQQVRTYIQMLRAFLDMSPSAREERLALADEILAFASTDLVSGLDAMVTQYEEEGEKAFETLHGIETFVVSATLITLLLEALFIFGPMARRIADQLAENAKIREELEKYNEGLEAEVILRTRELMAAKNAAETANQNKTRFLAAASHDLKQPLEAMGMFMGLLDRPGLDDRSRVVLSDMRAAHDSTRFLLESILEISKIETGSIHPTLEDFSIHSLLAPLARHYRERAGRKGLGFQYVECSMMVRSDRNLVERITRNLISNAVRYTNAGKILIGCRRAGDYLVLIVADTGPGIAEKDQKKVFEAFTQLADRDRDRSEGIGLGLTICDRLSRLLNHPLSLRSEVGRGSAFSLRLPISTVEMEIQAYDEVT